MADAGDQLRILLVRFGAIGDVVLTTPLIRTLRRAYPLATIVALTKASVAPVLSHNPHLTALELLRPGERLATLANRLRGFRFTHLLDLHGVLRSRLLRSLVPGNWTGYSKRRFAREVLIRSKYDLYRDAKPEAERFFEAAGQLGVEPDGDPAELGIADFTRAAVRRWCATELGGQPFIAAAPGAAHQTKMWPFVHWSRLLDRLSGAGHRIVLVGGPKEAELGAKLASSRSPAVISVCGRFDLQGSAALIGQARALVAGDTGLMHVATAVRTPVMVLLGPTVRQFGFMPYQARAEVIEMALPCRPCSKHGGPSCPLDHHDCLRTIDPDRVGDALERFVG